ncbi:MAG: hypothetical protein ACK5HA_14080 [Planctomycetaceae bacterium]
MNSDAVLVDEIVRQVLRQLNGLPSDTPARPAHIPAAPAPAASTTPASSSPTAAAASAESPFPPRQDPGEIGMGSGSAGRLLAPPTHFSAAAELLIGPVLTETPAVTTVVAAAVAAPAAAPAVASVPVPVPVVAPPVVAPRAPLAASHEVRISERVITGELLRRLAVGAVVQISPKALLTPSARDAVASLKLQVVRESATGPTTAGRQTSWLVLSAQPGTPLDSALPGWKTAGGRVELRRTATPAETAEQAIGALCRGEAQGVLVLSPEPEWIACLANRNDRVRGASVATAAALSRLSAGLKFNLLAVDGRGLTAADWNAVWPALAGAAGGAS